MNSRRENKTKYAVLGMLSFSPKSGYEISKAIERSTAYFWSESDGQPYPILRRLSEEGLVTHTSVSSEGKRSKKIYDITADGQQALVDWLLREPTTFNIRNEFLLQLYFGHNISTAENLQKITDFKHALNQQLKLYDSIEVRIKEKAEQPEYLLLSLSYGQHGLKAQIAWCEQTIEMLKTKL